MNNYMKVIINGLKQWVNNMLTVLDEKLTKRINDVATRQDDMVKSVNNTLPDENGNVQITVGGEQVQPDYEQNNPEAADYIKNRPFYIGESTITEIFDVAAYMAENNLEWEQYPIDDTYAVIQAQLPVTIPVVDGGIYTFIIDGVEYVETAQCVTQGGMSGFMFGEAPADINSLTFYAGIVPEMNMSMFMCKASALPTEFRIVGGSQEIKKLEKKFLPMPDDGYGWEEKTESEIVIEEQNIEGFAVLNEEAGTYSIELQKDEGFGFFDLQANKTYTVVIDGVQYETIVNGCNRNGATTYVLGDYDAFWEGASSLTSEMPFYLYENANGEFGMGTKLSGESHTISVVIPEIITVHRINEKYLPPEKPIIQSDWNINNSALESYIKNRPFYVEHVTNNTLYEDTFVYDGTIKISNTKVLEEGKTYSVNIDGALYTCKCWKYKETAEEANGIQLTWVGFGDGSRLGYENLKENVPFCCYQTTQSSSSTSLSGDFTEGEHYLKIAEYVLTQVHEMDDEYAPLLKRAKLLYPEQEIASTTGEEIISRYNTLALKQDTVYRITFNGKEYELPSWVDNVGRIVVGSPEKHEGGGSAQSDIPFALAYEDGNTPTEKLVRLVWDINTFASCILKIEEKYSETHSETILSLQTVNDFGQDENTSLYSAPINTDIVFEEGAKYDVIWDGSVYETSCEVITINDVPWYCIGNTGLLSNPATTDDNMPFVIFKCFFMGFGAVTQLDDVSHTVSIDKISEVNKIDSKYLPDNIGSGTVKSVNSIEPDENGNINVLGWEEGGYYYFDGNLDNALEVADIGNDHKIVKISTDAPELEDWVGGYILLETNEEEYKIDINQDTIDQVIQLGGQGENVYSFETFTVAKADSVNIAGITIPTKGIWITLSPEQMEVSAVFTLYCPGQTIVHKIEPKFLPEGIGCSAIPDWSINDETDPGFISNKPFYENNSIELVCDVCNMVDGWQQMSEGGYTFQLGAILTDEELELEPEKEYIITIDGNTYTSILMVGDEIALLGDVDAYGSQDFDNLTYIMLFYSVDGRLQIQIIVKGNVPTTFTVEKQNHELVKIDPKFLPDCIFANGHSINGLLINFDNVYDYTHFCYQGGCAIKVSNAIPNKEDWVGGEMVYINNVGEEIRMPFTSDAIADLPEESGVGGYVIGEGQIMVVYTNSTVGAIPFTPGIWVTYHEIAQKVKSVTCPGYAYFDKIDPNHLPNGGVGYEKISSEVGAIIKEQVLEGFSENTEGYYWLKDPFALGLNPGKDYTVKFDDTEYELKCKTYQGDGDNYVIRYIGNPSIINGGLEDDNTPFAIAIVLGQTVIYTKSTETSHTIGIVGPREVTTLVQIDEKFIPDTIARVSDASAPKTEFILASSTEGSTKQFKITIDDTGTLTVTEVE